MEVLIFVQLIRTLLLSCDEPQPFYQNPPLIYLPVSLYSSVLVLISPARQEQAGCVAHTVYEPRHANLARPLLSRMLCHP